MNYTTRLSLSSLPPTPSPSLRRAWLTGPRFCNLISGSDLTRSRSSGSIFVLSVRSDCRAISRRTPSITIFSSSPMNDELELTELREETDFEKLLSPNGHISICGFGSLLSGACDALISFPVDYTVSANVCASLLCFFKSREKREEYISWSDELQSSEAERLPASICSCCSDFLWAWYCQAGNNGS